MTSLQPWTPPTEAVAGTAHGPYRRAFLVIADGAQIGYAAWAPEGRCAAVSVAIDHGQRGAGHGTRALRLLLRSAFADPGIDHAEMRTDRSQDARKLAERAGFVLVEVAQRQATYRLERGALAMLA